MEIIYNPSIVDKGADIRGFNCEGVKVDHPAGELGQYSIQVADALVETYPFLRRVSKSEAEEIMKKKTEVKSLKCKYCDFTTDVPLGLSGHMRKHQAEVDAENEPKVDPTIIPIRETGTRRARDGRRTDEDDTRNGVDRDGVTWYGEGQRETRNSMRTTPPRGQGHFTSNL